MRKVRYNSSVRFYFFDDIISVLQDVQIKSFYIIYILTKNKVHPQIDHDKKKWKILVYFYDKR